MLVVALCISFGNLCSIVICFCRSYRYYPLIEGKYLILPYSRGLVFQLKFFGVVKQDVCTFVQWSIASFVFKLLKKQYISVGII